MKVIDLYVMLSKGEQPKKFKYRDEWYAYSIDDYDFRTLKQEYRDADVPTYQYLMEIIDASNLNDEVEIIEEDKKIEQIYYADLYTQDIHSLNDHINEHFNEVYNKIYELIDEVNKLKDDNK